MAWCPFAIHKPLPENATEPRIAPRTIILHSAVSRSPSLFGFFDSAGIYVESHFYIRWDGTIEQYMDTDRQADANYKANRFGLSIETEDDLDPNHKPWSPEQMASLIRLCDWLCDIYPAIPRRPCKSYTDSGIGYHAQFPEWSVYRGKTCPGTARVPQVPLVIEGIQSGPPPTPVPAPLPPSSEFDLEPLLATLPTIDFRPAASGSVVRHYLVDNIQGLLAGTQYGPANPGTIDGVGGQKTLQAVKNFQTMKKLDVDGVVGPNTWSALITH
jgi:hypothetical protein